MPFSKRRSWPRALTGCPRAKSLLNLIVCGRWSKRPGGAAEERAWAFLDQFSAPTGPLKYLACFPLRIDPAMSSSVVRVRAASRLHFGLLSLGGGSERQYGGVGVMVDAPGLTLSLHPAERLSAAGPLAERAMHFARQFAASGETTVGRVEPECHIEIESAPPEHVGLGTGTQLALAVAAGMATFGGAARGSVPVSDRDAVGWAQQVGRGERSAIGTHGFARGGLLVEGGKRAAGAVSPLIARLELPDAWRFVLLIDRQRQGLSGASERQAFAELPPTAANVTAALCRELLVELLPAAAEGDFEAFGESLYRYGHEAGLLFAQRQGGAYAPGLQTELVAWLRARGVRRRRAKFVGAERFCACSQRGPGRRPGDRRRPAVFGRSALDDPRRAGQSGQRPSKSNRGNSLIRLAHGLRFQPSCKNGGGYCTVPLTFAKAPGSNSNAIHASPENGDLSGRASSEEKPKRG